MIDGMTYERTFNRRTKHGVKVIHKTKKKKSTSSYDIVRPQWLTNSTIVNTKTSVRHMRATRTTPSSKPAMRRISTSVKKPKISSTGKGSIKYPSILMAITSAIISAILGFTTMMGRLSWSKLKALKRKFIGLSGSFSKLFGFLKTLTTPTRSSNKKITITDRLFAYISLIIFAGLAMRPEVIVDQTARIAIVVLATANIVKRFR